MQKPEDEILLTKSSVSCCTIGGVHFLLFHFDDALLVEYPFFYLNAKYIKSLSSTRLIVTHEAVEYFRYEELIIVLCLIL